MQIYEVQERTPALTAALVEVWEASVRATHLFLSDGEIEHIKNYVPAALGGVTHLVVAEENGRPVGFMGTEGERLEMLFLAPSHQGAGLGRRLLRLAVEQYGVREVTVNEQNPLAVGFYHHLGFETYKRTARDEAGEPYPLLYLRLREGGQCC